MNKRNPPKKIFCILEKNEKCEQNRLVEIEKDDIHKGLLAFLEKNIFPFILSLSSNSPNTNVVRTKRCKSYFNYNVLSNKFVSKRKIKG